MVHGTEQLALSVIVTAVTGPAALARVLKDLASQRGVPAFDVVVVDTTGSIMENDLQRSDLGGGCSLRRAIGCDVAEARAIGVPMARGDLIAFTEDHCRLPEDWCATAVRTRLNGYRAFGGVIENGSARGPADWAAYLVEFGMFMPPLPGGPTDALPGMNVWYDRLLIEDLPEGGLCEPIVNGYLLQRGLCLYLEPTLVVTFDRSFGGARFVRHCFASGRTFARLRLAHVPALHRLSYALAAAGLPVVLTGRIWARLAVRRQTGALLLLSLPWIVLYTCAWSVGEAIGALLPPPSSPARS
jgi:glycosyltransferase involved in cell wall biosynthesis